MPPQQDDINKKDILINDLLRFLATRLSAVIGSPWAFLLAVIMVFLWLISGPYFHFSSEWQFLFGIVTTPLTFLIVFSIQSTQKRDTAAIQLKLNELLRAVEGARTHLVSAEHLSDQEVVSLQEEFQQLHEDEIGAAADSSAQQCAPQGE